jgi:hypothetical protein
MYPTGTQHDPQMQPTGTQHDPQMQPTGTQHDPQMQPTGTQQVLSVTLEQYHGSKGQPSAARKRARQEEEHGVVKVG